MIVYLEKALNVRRNELAPASLLSLYLFFIIGFYIMGTSVGRALFLSAYRDYLPHAIIGTAVVVGVFAWAYIRLSHRVRLELMVIGALLFFALSFTAFWWLTRVYGKWVYPFIYMWVYMAGAMGPAMGWTLANYVLTTREARRVFGFIGAGQVLGAPCAGFFTSDMIKHRHMHPETLLFVMATLLALCAVVVKLLFRQARERLADAGKRSVTDQAEVKNFGQIWTYIRGSRYLGLITALIAIGCATTTIVTYQFNMIAETSFAGNKAALTAFFARFEGYMGLASFIVQMLLTGQLLRYFGIRITLFVLPVAFLGGTTAVFFAPMLLTASILKGSHNLLRFSLDKSSTELLYLPVAPPQIKSQIKSFIDGFIWRTADGVAGVALLLFANRLKFSPGRIGLLGIVFQLGWIAIAYGVRREYLNVLRRAIERRTLDPDRTTAGVLDSTTVEVMAQALERAGEQQVLYGLSLFEISREPASHPLLRGLLEHRSPAVRQRALRLLGDAGDRAIAPQVEKLVRDPALEVRTEALRYLVAHTGRDPLSHLTAVTDFPDYCVQGSVVAYLARTGAPENFAAAQVILESMLSRTGPEAVESRAEAASALGLVPPPSPLHTELLRLLRDQDPRVMERAILSAGKIQAREYLPLVIEKLGDRQLVAAASAVLAQYGDRAVGTLLDYLNDVAVPLVVRKRIPDVLARIPTGEAVAVLANSLIQSDPGLRYDVLKALNKIRRRDPALLPAVVDFADMVDAELVGYYRSFQILAALDARAGIGIAGAGSRDTGSVLVRALRERMEREFERIFRLLALLYPPRDIYNAYVGLTSGRPRIQANAIEVLENLLPQDLYRRLSCAVDPEISAEEKLRFAKRHCHACVESKAEALRILLHTEDTWLRACALYAVGEERLVDLSKDVQQVPHEQSLVAETWQWAARRLQAAATA